MQKRSWKKVLAVVLSIAILAPVFSTLVWNTGAEELPDDIEISEALPAEIIGEDPALRTEDSKSFRLENTGYIYSTYNTPVHRWIDGAWEDINNSLKLSNQVLSASGRATYVPQAGRNPVSIPQDFANGQKITLSNKGYTVSFGVSAENESVRLDRPAKVTDVDDLRSNNLDKDSSIWEEIKDTVTGLFEKDEPKTVEEINAEKMQLKNLTSAVTYKNVFPDTYLDYIVSPKGIKENIVVEKSQESYGYQFTFDTAGLIPAAREDGSIWLVEQDKRDEAVFILQAPYMYDAKGEYSDAVEMKLEDGILTITADTEWINDEDRTLPVVIDPTLNLSYNTSNVIEDTYVSTFFPNGNPSSNILMSNTILNVGQGMLELSRTYLKFNLPVLPDCSIITNATFQMQKDPFLCYSGVKIYAYDLKYDIAPDKIPDWNPTTVTWNNQPANKGKNACMWNPFYDFLDYDTGIKYGSTFYEFNLTRAFASWYTGGRNNGILLTSEDENTWDQVDLFSIRHGTASNRPVLTLEYINNTGMESYWTNERVDLGRSGTAFVNHYSGALTYMHSDLSMSGNRMPLSIGHVYNSTKGNSSGTYGSMKLGNGFRLNILEQIISSSISNFPYKLVDGNGTVYYFKSTGVANQYAYEFDSSLKLNKTVSGFTLKDEFDNQKEYNTSGFLTSISDTNGNTQAITWSGNRITQVKDAVLRTATFTYSGDYLASITDPAGRVTNFTYSGNNLSQITYPDGKTTKYTYDGNGNVTKIETDDSSTLEAAYKTISQVGGTKIYRTEILTRSGKLVSGSRQLVDKITFNYTNVQTVVKHNTGSGGSENVEENTYVFDNTGRSVNVWDKHGRATFAEYHDFNAGNLNNKLIWDSTPQTAVENLVKNSNFETNSTNWPSWSNDGTQTSGRSTDYAYTGDYSQWVQRNTSGYSSIYQDVPPAAFQIGKTYTFSAFVNLPEAVTGVGVKVILQAWNGGTILLQKESEALKNTFGEWERLWATLTVPANTTALRCNVYLDNGTGRFYTDGLQLELGEAANSLNLLENGGMHYTEPSGKPSGWSCSGNMDASDKVYKHNPDEFYMGIFGYPDLQKSMSQTVQVNAKAGETLSFGGVAVTAATGRDIDTRYFDIEMTLTYTDNSTKTIPVRFYRSVLGRQMVADSFTLLKDCKQVKYNFRYFNQGNSACLVSAFLYLDSFGSNYSYLPSGKLKTTESDTGESVKYTYTNDGYVDQVVYSKNGSELGTEEYTYDNNDNLISQTTTDGVTIEYSYDSQGSTGTTYGLPTGIKVTGANGEFSESSMHYLDDEYNYLDTITDARGGITAYTYNKQKGLLMSVTDPEGNTESYTYDANNDRLLSTTGKADSVTPITNNYAYQDGAISGITRNGTTYSYERDSFNRITASKVGNQTLVSNTYDNRNRPAQQTYANGAVHTAVYDSRDHLSGEKWDNVQTAAYSYNDKDQLTRMEDKLTGVTYKYDYALYGLLNKVHGSDGTLTAYDYDTTGKLSRLNFLDNGDKIHMTRYYTNQVGNPEDVILVSLGNTALHYEYDGLNRLTGKSIGPLLSTITYLEGGGQGSTANLVETYTNEDGDGNPLQQYTYTYDANGNIIEIAEAVSGMTVSYIYDGLNRLISETYGSNSPVEYNYDAGGNLISVTQDSSTLHSYTYDDPNWPDKLTAVDGISITYDAMGNPLACDVIFDFSWQKGRQLTDVSLFGTPTLSYEYDASGRRVSKTFNGITTDFLYSGDLLMRQTDGTDTLDFQYDVSGKAVGFNYNGTPYYYLRNLQGDVVAITDADGNLEAQYGYDAWGNTLYCYGGAVAYINPIRYRGYYLDVELNVYFLQTRFYIPEWGRFLNADGTFIAGSDAINGSNMYAYCNDNPVMYVDPSGRGPILRTTVAWVAFNLIGGNISPIRDLVDRVTVAYVHSSYNLFQEDFWRGAAEFVFGGLSNDFSHFSGSWLGRFIFEQVVPGMVESVMSSLDPYLSRRNDNWRMRDANLWFFGFGLQNFLWNYTMEEGAAIGAFFLEFFPEEYNGHTNYYTREGQYQWQSNVGYNYIYDFFFSVGGPIKKLVYDFEANGKFYALWCWKADYWNLGAGAEIGIYCQEDQGKADRGFYDIDKDNLKVKLHMKINYQNTTISDIKQTNWWVTSFTPKHQRIKIADLDVWQAVSFYSAAYNPDHSRYLDGNGVPYIEDPSKHGYPDTITTGKADLFTYFYGDWNQAATNNHGDGKYLSWSPTAGQGWEYRDTNYAQYEFYIKF